MIHTALPRALIGSVRAAASGPEQLFRDLQASLSNHMSQQSEHVQNLESALQAIQRQVNGGVFGVSDAAPGGALTDTIRTNLRAAMRGQPQAMMEIGSGPDGGFTVPVQVDSTIMALLRATSPMRRMATVVTLGTGSGSWRKIVTRSGGGTSWAHELETREETGTPKLGAVEITPEEIYAIPEVTNQVLDDSAFSLEQFLSDDVAAEFALGEAAAFISGDGVKKPLGIAFRPTAATADDTRPFGTYQHIVTGAAGDFGEEFQDNLIDLIFKLPAAYRVGDGVGWLMNSLTASKVMKFKDADGRLMWREGLTAGDPAVLLGYPVAIDENMPDIAPNALAIAFGNWRRGYAIVDRVGMKMIRDNVTKKGWTKLYFSKRVGGAPLDSNAIKFLKFSAA